MAKKFSELTKDFSMRRKFRVWIGKQRILFDIWYREKKESRKMRKGYKANAEDNLKMMEDFKYIDAESWENMD